VPLTLGTAWFLVVVGLVGFAVAAMLGYKGVAVISAMLIVGVGAAAMVDGGLAVQSGKVVTQTGANTTVTEPTYRTVQTTDRFPLEVLILLLGSVLTLRGIDSVGSKS
jgi:hypothetical protein